jgi:hypothetical protein
VGDEEADGFSDVDTTLSLYYTVKVVGQVGKARAPERFLSEE